VATDVLDHTTTDSSKGYTTAGIAGLTGSSVKDALMTTASSKWLFRAWGKVSVIDANSFTLDCGSGTVITVIAPGYSGIGEGDYASARGILNVSGSTKTLTCNPAHIRKYN
jgi:hypothetical protein